MKKVARKHGMVCLLHEKPFAGVNGSGKHNNWSISTDTGVNLLEPGRNAAVRTRSSCCFCAPLFRPLTIIRTCCACPWPSAGNDHRLGANEAPPAVVSMFLGDGADGDSGRDRIRHGL